jgi:formate dehydrogenase major subunit
MIKYVIDDIEKNPQNYNMDYIIQYTNASFIVNANYKFTDGLFGEVAGGKYTAASKAAWKYADMTTPAVDTTLKNPACVFQMLKQHYARYDVDTVCSITGTPLEDYRRICDIYTSTYLPTRAGTWLYAMGTTQHTSATQNIRSYAILQMILGNVGLAGGGINALRGESNVQGSTDHALLYHILPGYLKSPVPADTDWMHTLRASLWKDPLCQLVG